MIVTRRGVILTSSGYRPRILLNVLVHTTALPPPTKNYPAPNIRGANQGGTT